MKFQKEKRQWKVSNATVYIKKQIATQDSELTIIVFLCY